MALSTTGLSDAALPGEELSSPDVERPQARPGPVALRLEDPAGLDGVGLAEEFDHHGDALDAPDPRKLVSSLKPDLLRLFSSVRYVSVVATSYWFQCDVYSC